VYLPLPDQSKSDAKQAVSFFGKCKGEMLRVKPAIAELKKHYNVKYNDNLELITIRHYMADIEKPLIGERKIMVVQKSRTAARFLVRNITG
jgi:aspartate kinase